MAPREMDGVVDGSLKVYGTTNLRAVDASIMPTQLGCHIQATIYAIAEKVSIRNFLIRGFPRPRYVEPDTVHRQRT